MRVTAILRDFTDQFYNGTESGSIVGLLALSDAEKWEKIKSMAADKRIPLKIGSGQFREQVDLNRMLREPCAVQFTLEPRRGYKLAVFNIEPMES